MDFELNDDQQAFIDTAKQFAAKSLAPNAAEWDAEAIFPKDVLREAGELGFMSLYTPESVGGMGISRLDAALIFEELAGGCTSTAAFMTIHNMALWMIATFGNEETIERFTPKLLTGEHLASYCLTEPGAGSDAASLRTVAKVDGDGDDYVLSGQKVFISGAGDTDVLVVMARVDDGSGPQPGAKGISSFVVPADAPGVEYGRKEEKMGWNSQPTRAITFDGARIPKANRLGDEGDGFKIAMKGLDGGRINIATTAVGTAQAALDASARYVQEREQFGGPLAQFQSVQFKLADMATELVAARQMVRLAATRLDAKHPEASVYCAMAKRFATDVAFEVCNEAVQLHGGYGYIREYPLERHLRDVRVHQILEGTNEVMRLIVSRRVMMEGATDVIR
jgi:alkylation response protein AidB-like acyl-CoA dehydrogenase